LRVGQRSDVYRYGMPRSGTSRTDCQEDSDSHRLRRSDLYILYATLAGGGHFGV